MEISTRGKTCGGRWYPRPDRYVIFINKLHETFNSESEFELFLSLFLSVEFHELGHIYGFRGGCKDCKNGCFWCDYTFTICKFFIGNITYR